MSQPILLTGGNGFVAGSIIAQCPEETTLHVLSRTPLHFAKANLQARVYESMEEEEWRGILDELAPSVILHTAAIAAIDYCEAHQEEAEAVNARFPATLARLAGENGIRLIHCSTDTVFDGAHGPYHEEDEPLPVNFYGKTKLAAEKAVASAVEDAVIARISLVYGLSIIGTGNSFLAQMIPKLERGEQVGVPENEIRSAIDVATLGAALLELAGNDYRGLIHLSGNEILNRVQLIRRLAQHLQLDPALVVPNDPTNIPGRAPRPLDVSLSNARAREVLKTPFLDTEEGLDAVRRLKERNAIHG